MTSTTQECFDGPRSFWLDYEVVDAAGAIFREGSWLVSVGVHEPQDDADRLRARSPAGSVRTRL